MCRFLSLRFWGTYKTRQSTVKGANLRYITCNQHIPNLYDGYPPANFSRIDVFLTVIDAYML